MVLFLAASGDCVEPGQGDEHACCRAGGLQICPGWHQERAGTGWGEWAVESLPLGLYPAVFAVRGTYSLFWYYTLTSSSDHFVDYLLERPDVAPVWERFINHPFVLAMGDGTLPLESFKGYLMQDYVYLVWCPRSLQPTLC
jgi:hypothetical protein